jgi:hypothetical protein
MLVYAGGQGVNLGDLPAGSIVGQVVNPMSLTLYSVFIVAGPGIPRPYVHTYQNSGTHVGSAADRILTL